MTFPADGDLASVRSWPVGPCPPWVCGKSPKGCCFCRAHVGERQRRPHHRPLPLLCLTLYEAHAGRVTSDEPNRLDQRIQGLLWTAAQLYAVMAGQPPSAAARAARFAREQFAALPVTHAAGRRQRCRICRRTLSTNKRKDAIYCSARCRDQACRKLLDSSAARRPGTPLRFRWLI